MFENTEANFSWNYGQYFFVETKDGNYVWADPDYGGDNSFHYFHGTYRDFIRWDGVPYCRDKGRHFIHDYCGKDIVLGEEIYPNKKGK